MELDLHSSLYQCRVMHHRLSPKKHKFIYNLFMFYLNLDELDFLSKRLSFFSRNRFNLFNFRDGDHLPTSSKSLKQKVIEYASQHGVSLEKSRIMLLTNLRTLGYIFNPVSFYFCFDQNETPLCAIAEVNNTFHETKLFFMGKEHLAEKDLFKKVMTKYFYVSPFMNLDIDFEFKLKVPSEKLELHINDLQKGERTLLSSLTGFRKKLNDLTLLCFALKYPLITLKVIFLIHWNSLILLLKKIPYNRKESNPHLQRHVLNSYYSTAKESYRFYKSILLKSLQPMTLGSLRIQFSDGSEKIFGQNNGTECASIRVSNPVFFKKSVLFGDIGFGESYTDGDWESENIYDVIKWLILNIENSPVISGSKRKNPLVNLLRFYNRFLHQSRSNNLNGSKENIHDHYDLGVDFFRSFLDPTLTYSCAYFQTPNQSLEEAQKVKYDLLCQKLRLKPSDHLLEIGGGWGGFSLHAAKNYGSKITTITISKDQFDYSQKIVRQEGLLDRIHVKLIDYRLLEGKYDKIVSIEMLEAVGHEYLERYFDKCHRLLKKDGLLGLQMITCPDSRYDSLRKNVDWIQKHIFPGSLLLSIGRVNQAINRTSDMHLYDLEDMGHFYVKTLSKWQEAFNNSLEKVRSLGFDDRFIRKWNYYFSYCKAAFATKNISVVQAIYTHPNNKSLR